MQTRNRFFDDMARLVGGAAGLAQGLGEEASTAFRSGAERMAAKLDLVTREEFEAMVELARNARAEGLALKLRVEQLEAELAALRGVRK